MADQKKYLVQLKLSAGTSLYGDYSKGLEIAAQDDEEALEKAREYLAERQWFGQFATGFRLLRIVHDEKSTEEPEEE